jgi:hypothetical protein
MSIAELNTLYTAAIAARAAGDYDTAILHAQSILLRLATMPNVTQGSGGDTQGLTFPGADSVREFIATTNQAKAAALHAAGGGIFRQSKIVYARPDAVEDA